MDKFDFKLPRFIEVPQPGNHVEYNSDGHPVIVTNSQLIHYGKKK